MKKLIFLFLMILVGCGNLMKEKSDAALECMTREEVRALCYVEEMDKLGHDPSMDAWVKNQCATIYATEGCYHGVY